MKLWTEDAHASEQAALMVLAWIFILLAAIVIAREVGWLA